MFINRESIQQSNDIFQLSLKNKWKRYNGNNKQSTNSKNISDGDISNAFHDIPMKNISISIDFTSSNPDDKNPNDKNSLVDTYIENLNDDNLDYSYSSDQSDETYVPDVSLAYPKTPREKTQRRIVLTWTLGASLLLITPVLIGKFYF